MTLSCIAVDDEPLALGLVCAFVEKTPFLHLTGRYS
ncbi:MAG: DNA-binding response regulator, partial [Cytophagaceae bacterium]